MLMNEYWLIGKNNCVLPVTIQEDAKEDFKELMDWSEKQFKEHTCVRHKKSSKNSIGGV